MSWIAGVLIALGVAAAILLPWYSVSVSGNTLWSIPGWRGVEVLVETHSVAGAGSPWWAAGASTLLSIAAGFTILAAWSVEREELMTALAVAAMLLAALSPALFTWGVAGSMGSHALHYTAGDTEAGVDLGFYGACAAALGTWILGVEAIEEARMRKREIEPPPPEQWIPP